VAKLSHPRHGSLGFSPRKRAKKPSYSPSSYPTSEQAKALGFAGYKAGMTRIRAIDKNAHSPAAEQEISIPVTIIECPVMNVFGIRLYKKTLTGLKCLTEVWADKFNKNLSRKIKTPKKKHDVKTLENQIETASEIRLLLHTNASFKKTPEVLEIKVGGNKTAALEYAKSILGKTISIADAFEEGQYVDVIGVTKGKGIQGPVKRWGTRIQYRKAHGKRRHVGALNPWTPVRTMWTALIAGQTGYHKRTKLNSRILKIGKDGKEVTPAGGITKFGVVKTEYVLLQGSVPGPKKRMLALRPAIRPPKEKTMPEIKQIITTTQQGRSRT